MAVRLTGLRSESDADGRSPWTGDLRTTCHAHLGGLCEAKRKDSFFSQERFRKIESTIDMSVLIDVEGLVFQIKVQS